MFRFFYKSDYDANFISCFAYKLVSFIWFGTFYKSINVSYYKMVVHMCYKTDSPGSSFYISVVIAVIPTTITNKRYDFKI